MYYNYDGTDGDDNFVIDFAPPTRGRDYYIVNGGNGHDIVDISGMPSSMVSMANPLPISSISIEAVSDSIYCYIRYINDERNFGIDIELHNVEEIIGTNRTDTFRTVHDTLMPITIYALGGDDGVTGSLGDDHLYGGDGNDSLSGSYGDDVLAGGNGADWLDGGGGFGDDVLIGGAGADKISGQKGMDAADYSTSSAAVIVTLGLTGRGGDAEGDIYDSIENLSGSEFDDFLTGDIGANVLDGGAGNDTLRGSAGADDFIGGGGVDTVSYTERGLTVKVNLSTAVGSGGGADGDTFSGIENIDGGQVSDDLTGNGAVNVLQGFGGNDVLRGGGGSDRLIGGAGVDTVSYTDSSATVTVSLASHAGNGGDAQGDYIEAENVNGSAFNDALYADAGSNVLNGWAGRDILEGRGGADRFVFSAAAHSSPGVNADKITDFSHADGDWIELSAIDANDGMVGDQAFKFVGNAAYSHTAGELHYAFSGNTTIIGGDVNGDGVSDFNIVLIGKVALVASDLVL